MSSGRKRLLIILLAIAVALWVAGAVATPIVNGLDAKTRADNTIVNGFPFIFTVIGIIVAFIDFIILMATRLNNKVEPNLHATIERLLIAGIVLGVIGMFQPFTITLYTFGFILLLISTFGFIFWSHIVPHTPVDRAVRQDDGLGTVSISQVEHKQVEG